MKTTESVVNKTTCKFIIVCAVVWIIYGLCGHHPWKPDEAYTTGLVYSMVNNGDWLVPTLAGEPFMEKPPIYFWTAAAFAKEFSPFLALHDAMRLASGFFMAIFFICVFLGSKAFWGRRKNGFLALLFLMGSFGLVAQSHLLITDVALLAGFSVAFFGLTKIDSSQKFAGFLIGTGVGLGFMAKGMLILGIFGLSFCIIFPALFFFKRSELKKYTILSFFAFLSVLPWLLIWPILLYQESRLLFMEWFWRNNFGRFFGFGSCGPVKKPFIVVKSFPWQSFPASIIAFFVIFKEKKFLFRKVSFFALSVVWLITLLTLSIASENGRTMYGLPLVFPLVIIASGWNFESSKQEKFFSAATLWLKKFFGILILVSCMIWLCLKANLLGRLEQFSYINNYFSKAEYSYFNFIGAILAVIFCIYALRLSKQNYSRWNFIFTWTILGTTAWALAMSLWLPLIDARKRYDWMMEDLVKSIPKNYKQDILSLRLGEPQRGLLEYYHELKTKRIDGEWQFVQDCKHPVAKESIPYDYKNLNLPEYKTGTIILAKWLVGEDYNNTFLTPRWKCLWRGARDSDKIERYALFQKQKD